MDYYRPSSTSPFHAFLHKITKEERGRERDGGREEKERGEGGKEGGDGEGREREGRERGRERRRIMSK
jgi:hypothetical protein